MYEINLVNQPVRLWTGGEIVTDQFYENHLHKIKYGDNVMLKSRLSGSVEIMRLLLYTKALHELGAKVHCCITYLPYARDDRGLAIGLKTITSIVEMCNFDTLEILEPHSKNPLIKYRTIHLESIFKPVLNKIKEEFLQNSNSLVFVAPDEGARTRAHMVWNEFSSSKFLVLEKIRKPGVVIINKVEQDLNGKMCVVVDDICDGGRTFVDTARVLKEAGCTNLRLIVCHGIFSYESINDLKKEYEKIYTTNSFRDFSDEELQSIEVTKVI